MNRIKRSRAPGSKLPPYTLCVSRGTHFGNKFSVVKKPYNVWLVRGLYASVPWFRKKSDATMKSVELFRAWLKQPEQDDLCKEFIERCLRDKIEHVACWCDVDSCCHGDVWLELWNSGLTKLNEQV